MEKLDLSNWGERAKILGTANCDYVRSRDLRTTDPAVGELRLYLGRFSPCRRCLRVVSLSDLPGRERGSKFLRSIMSIFIDRSTIDRSI